MLGGKTCDPVLVADQFANLKNLVSQEIFLNMLTSPDLNSRLQKKNTAIIFCHQQKGIPLSSHTDAQSSLEHRAQSTEAPGQLESQGDPSTHVLPPVRIFQLQPIVSLLLVQGNAGEADGGVVGGGGQLQS